MKSIASIFVLIGLLLTISSCEQGDSEELTLQQLQKDEVNDIYKYKLRATIGVSQFNTNQARFIDLDTLFQIQAKMGTQTLSLYLPYLGVGTFYGANDSKVSMAYINSKQRYFVSNNFRIPSDVRITITEIDTVLNRLNGSFAGKLYDPSSNTPEQSEDQVVIYSGQLVRLNF